MGHVRISAQPYTHPVGTFGVFQLAAFVIGLLFGSFLNVCITRLPRGESVVRPRSRCPQCGTPICWHDNIPVLSWFFLRHRCRQCSVAIPWQYPLVELAVGFWFFLAGQELFLLQLAKTSRLGGPTPAEYIAAFAFAILGFLLIGLTVMDWQTMVLPDAFTLGGIAIGLFLVCTQAIFLAPKEDEVLLTKHSLHLTSPGGVVDSGNVFLTGAESLIFGRIAAICGAALLLLLIRWLYQAIRHREGMGLGDVKLIGMIAAFLGFWPAVLSLFVGTLAAGFYGVLLLIRGKAGSTSKLPFGSFLSIGGLVAALYGNRLIDMYIALLH
jgi:leader peptidase (prepilin peptidase)/N-methyltransferase